MKSRANRVLLNSGVLTAGLLATLAGVASPRALAAEDAPPPPAATEEPPFLQPFEIGIFGGLHFYDKQHGLGRYVGSPEGYSPDLGGVFGLRLAYNLNCWLGVEAEGSVSPTHTRFNDANGGTRETILGYRLQVIGNFIHTGYMRPFALVGWGALSEIAHTHPGPYGVPFNDTDDMFHIGVGSKFPLTDYFGLRLDGRIMFPPAAFVTGSGSGERYYHGPDWEILLSAYLAFGRTPPSPPPPALPPPPPPPPADTDGDGIPDSSDACPNEPGPKSSDPSKNGCPRPKDTDGDGILDVNDACPNEPGPRNDDPTKNGCPPPKDTDGDGIPDNIDKCPNEPETFNGYQDEDGCPDEVPAALKKFTGVIEGITFKTNSANLTKKSYDVLDNAVQVLTDYPDTRIEISGHTDNVGKDEYNKELSQKRADAVKEYFVNKGIKSERLTAIGYGPEKPIADNKTKAGKAKNRRTEFKLVTGN
jgi:OmpA-OmpF porin, OOP family